MYTKTPVCQSKAGTVTELITVGSCGFQHQLAEGSTHVHEGTYGVYHYGSQ